MYVAVKGGETAILNSYKLLAEQRRGEQQPGERADKEAGQDGAAHGLPQNSTLNDARKPSGIPSCR